jgi:hypothetical protein
MAARLYLKGKENLLGGNVDLQNDTIVALLVTGQYVPNTDSDETRAAIPSSAIVAEETLSSTKIVDGVFDADDVVFTEVTGAPIRYIVLIKDDDIYSRALLIALIDDAAQFPVTPDGSNITIQWDNGANKIFSL